MTRTEKTLKWVLRYKDIVKKGALYLRRHYLTPRTWCRRLFLHLIVLPDDDRYPHDHPWDFYTLVLRGGYDEEVFDQGRLVLARRLRAGSFLLRRAEHTHKITKVYGRAWTLVLACRTRRVWGFWSPEGTFTPWNQYLMRADGTVPEQLPEDALQT